MHGRRPDRDEDWRDVADAWRIRPDTVYLNHGSFGPPPIEVSEAQDAWRARMREQPMDFFTRRFEPAWIDARDSLARFLNDDPPNVALVENSTVGMNIVARSFPLEPGDEVLVNDHEYGAVLKIWRRACDERGAVVRVAQLPRHCDDPQDATRAIWSEAGERTRLVVVSHITSPTAITLPVTEICHEARARRIATCVDGPHAVAQLPLDMKALDCDFYTASCHKWLSAPLGSGFLRVAPRWHERVEPCQWSWGVLPPRKAEAWWEEFLWTGTRDPSAYLAVPHAIGFLERIGLDAFRARSHELAQYARRRLVERFGTKPITADSPRWYSSMAHVPLPPGDARGLQRALWESHGIEVPIVEFAGERYVRVSCHLYNTMSHIDRLLDALGSLCGGE
ncbi:MAG: aminotransferase class V-fold PLP-dependent enzyme [Planctomycetes bacterium]|nr:aminotransferase class V-fold PLP-dependent enzyme [Planctomycetota bacterium]